MPVSNGMPYKDRIFIVTDKEPRDAGIEPPKSSILRSERCSRLFKAPGKDPGKETLTMTTLVRAVMLAKDLGSVLARATDDSESPAACSGYPMTAEAAHAAAGCC